MIFFPLFILMMTQASWKAASALIRGMREGVPSARAKVEGLVDASSGEPLALIEDVPTGVEVGMDGAWALDSASRLTRPGILSALGAGSVAILAWAMLEMGKQI